MTYIISTQTNTRLATSKTEALAIARQMAGLKRLYKGAEYQQDASDKTVGVETENGRVYGMATDYWEKRANAARQMNSQADAVIMAVRS